MAKPKRKKQAPKNKEPEPDIVAQDDSESEDMVDALLGELRAARVEEPVVVPARQRQPERVEEEKPSIKAARDNAKWLERVKMVRAELDAESRDALSRRDAEIAAMTRVLNAAGLEVFEVPADGNCLFAAIADQLRLRSNVERTPAQLRQDAAEHIGAHVENFAPYLDTAAHRDVSAYCAALQSPGFWGGEMEIVALAQRYGCPVHVYSATQRHLQVCESLAGPPLSVCYYRSLYGLGAHYNSTRDAKRAGDI